MLMSKVFNCTFDWGVGEHCDAVTWVKQCMEWNPIKISMSKTPNPLTVSELLFPKTRKKASSQGAGPLSFIPRARAALRRHANLGRAARTGSGTDSFTQPAPGMESLPEAVLIRILASIPAVDLVLACRLVCCRWKDLVDGAALWILKCQQEGLTRAESDADNWQNFYFLSKKKKNLIKNPCGEEDLEHWGEVENGGDGWKIEELPGDFGKEFPSEEVHKYFVTSYEWCRKAQVIDLRAEGYWEELMDTTQPKIMVRDWYAGRRDAGCLYELCVRLLSENEDVLAEYKSETITIPQENDASWTEEHACEVPGATTHPSSRGLCKERE